MAEQRLAVLIGNSTFPKEPKLADLRCPENDVEGFAQVLGNPERGDFEVVSLPNKVHHEIQYEIYRALKRAQKDDLVLIYYSGHGKLNRSGKLFLTAYNTEVDFLEATALPTAQLYDYVHDSYCNRVVVILDCCYGGAVGNVMTRSTVDDQLQQVSGGRGIYVLTASTATQTAQEKEGDRYGVFTKHLIQGIQTGQADLDQDGWIGVDELYRYAHRAVLQESSQEPTRWGLGARGEIRIARSGCEPRQERIGKVISLLADLVAKDTITEEIEQDGRRIAKLPADQLNAIEQQKDQLLDRLLSGKIGSGPFVVQWIQLSQKPAPALQIESFSNQNRQQTPQPPSSVPPRTPVSLPQIQYIHGWSSEQVKDLQQRTADALYREIIFRDELRNGRRGPEMIIIPAGEFEMGSPKNEENRSSDEHQHRVSIEKPFAMGRYAVTFDEYDVFIGAVSGDAGLFSKLLGKTRKSPSDEGWGRGNRPVINVSWEDAVAYAEWLSEQTGKRYRLPTEAEWEYAARAGTTTPFWFGKTISTDQANYDGNDIYGNGSKGVYRQKTVPVDSFEANPWGLYNVHGNVWEWTCSEYVAEYNGAEQRCISNNRAIGRRGLRGGSWVDTPAGVRSAARLSRSPGGRGGGIGFRLAQDL